MTRLAQPNKKNGKNEPPSGDPDNETGSSSSASLNKKSGPNASADTSGTSNKSGTLRTRQKEKRIADILKAAIFVMARKGYHQTRISDIAQEAGVAYGLVYHYFGSKEKVLAAILENIWERFGERIEKISGQDSSTVEKLSELSDYMLDTCIARPDIIELLVHEIVRARNIENLPDMEIVRRILRLIEQIFQDGIQNGELEASADPRLMSMVFFGSLEMVLTAISTTLYDTEPYMTARKIRIMKKKMRHFIRGGSFGKEL